MPQATTVGAAVSAHRQDEVGHVALLCNDLQPRHRLRVADNVPDACGPVLLHLAKTGGQVSSGQGIAAGQEADCNIISLLGPTHPP